MTNRAHRAPPAGALVVVACAVWLAVAGCADSATIDEVAGDLDAPAAGTPSTTVDAGSSAEVPDGPSITVAPPTTTEAGRDGVGTVAVPAALGTIMEFDGWRGGIVDVLDATEAGLLASFAEPAGADRTHLAVLYEATYLGPELSAFEPFVVEAVGSATYRSFDSDCALDLTATAALGVSPTFDGRPGSPLLLATCITVPAAEVDDLVFTLDDALAFGAPVIYAADGTEAPPLGPAEVARPEVDPVPFGREVDVGRWRATVVAVEDAAAAGLVSPFAAPPPDGSVHLAITYRATYTGADPAAAEPFLVEALGSAVYEPFASSCFLDSAALAARGVDEAFEAAPGTTLTKAVCVTVPAAEVPELLYTLDSVEAVELPTVVFAPA